MATANKQITFEYLSTLTFSQWSANRVGIADQIDANYAAGYLTDAQVVAIWNNFAQVVQAEVDRHNQESPPTTVIKIPYVDGSATAPTTAKQSASLIDKVIQGWGFIFDKTGDALGNAGKALMGGVSIGSYLILGLLILFIMKFVKVVFK